MSTPYNPSEKALGAAKLARIPVKVETNHPNLPKPDWIRIKLGLGNSVNQLKGLLRSKHLVTVCEEAACPNLTECFSHGIATFMIMGDKCTRRCTFCNVGHGRPDPLDPEEPNHLAETIQLMNLKYVVITSVDRDDLRDGGAGHFAACIQAARSQVPSLKIEVLVPDFRGRRDQALDQLALALPDVFNHNIETVPRLYKSVRPGSDYQWSLELLQTFKQRFKTHNIPTKSGIMLGLGETDEEVKQTLLDLRNHQVDMVTIGQYLQPTAHHHPVLRYVHPDQFQGFAELAKQLGFVNVASGPLVRSSYHADKQAAGETVR
ncbi:MAG: lipoyl synthase [Proteobacteria bacterium]|nr:lipoyl synthase [Pseudomonadota bacterium]